MHVKELSSLLLVFIIPYHDESFVPGWLDFSGEQSTSMYCTVSDTVFIGFGVGRLKRYCACHCHLSLN
jgi:hypothetical protein